MTPFQRIFDHAVAKCPRISAMHTGCVHEWLNKGYDTEKDIIPAIDEATKSGGNHIKYFTFFDGFIRKRNEDRIKQAHKPLDRNQTEIDATRAKRLRWLKDSGIKVTGVNQQDYAWLEQYEKGEVNHME